MNKDLRVRKTQQAIRKAFRELLTEKMAEEISIKELTERAMVSRRTFYHHFSSLEELAKVMQEEYVDRLISELKKWTLPAQTGQAAAAFFAFMEREGVFGSRILEYGDRAQTERLYTGRAEALIWEEEGRSEYEKRLRRVFFAFGLYEICLQWNRDNREFTREEVTAIAVNLLERGAQAEYEL